MPRRSRRKRTHASSIRACCSRSPTTSRCIAWRIADLRSRDRRQLRRAIVVGVSAAVAAGCIARHAESGRPSIDQAARSYVRLALALGDRDADSLDSYHGPPAWQTEARREHATLAEIRGRAVALTNALNADRAGETEDAATRRAFLTAQLTAISSRIEILQGARPSFADETRGLFGLDPHDAVATTDAGEQSVRQSIDAARVELDRLLPGRGDLAARYAAFDRQFLVPAGRLAAVLSRAIEGCRAATRARLELPAGERVDVEDVHDLPWSAFTRYEGRSISRVEVNAAMPLTVDRALDLACHEAYPGHHTIAVLLDARFGDTRPEFFVQPLFSMQSALHEAASSLAPALAFPEAARIAFERDALFPLAGFDPAQAARHVAAGRLVDRLHTIEADVARTYLDGALDFPRAAAALERDALMPSAEATLKFLNQFRSYAATYTIGRDLLDRVVDRDWAAYHRAVTAPAQRLPPPPK